MMYSFDLLALRQDYDYYMGLNGEGKLSAVCASEDETSTYARVFEQDDDDVVLSVSCIQFGYFMNGQTEVTLSLYMDANGGEPDDDMELVGSINVTTINAVGQFQVQTASFPEPVDVVFESDSSTLVVVLSTPAMAEGFVIGGGAANAEVVETIGDTFVGGSCMAEWTAYYDYANANDMASTANNQWYVKLHASETGGSDSGSSDGDDDKLGLSDGELAGVVVGSIAGIGILGVAGYFVYSSFFATASKTPLLGSAA